MIAINDIAMVADANDRWEAEANPKRKLRQNAARLYFARVLLSHVHEALKMVEEISKSATLRAAVDQCDRHTVAEFEELEAILNSPERAIFNVIRSRMTFHYDLQLPKQTTQEIADAEPDRPWSYSMGHEPLDWHFELGDAIIDRMIIRRGLGLNFPRSSRRTSRTAQIAGRLQEISRKFTSFAGHFVRRHSK
jgi:hypothetical protein